MWYIFERFYRSDGRMFSLQQHQSGVGIGFVNPLQIVEAYRYNIDVSSEQVVGTRFDLTFHWMEKRRHLNLSFKSVISLRRFLVSRHASFRACFLCVLW